MWLYNRIILVTAFLTIFKSSIVLASTIMEVSNTGMPTRLIPFQLKSFPEIRRTKGLFYLASLGLLSSLWKHFLHASLQLTFNGASGSSVWNFRSICKGPKEECYLLIIPLRKLSTQEVLNSFVDWKRSRSEESELSSSLWSLVGVRVWRERDIPFLSRIILLKKFLMGFWRGDGVEKQNLTPSKQKICSVDTKEKFSVNIL